MMTRAHLSKDQVKVYDGIMDWAGTSRPLLRVGGFAGTGKTTLLGLVASELDISGSLVAYATYTGRAASILQRKLKACGVDTTNAPADSFGGKGKRIKKVKKSSRVPFCGTIHSLLYMPVIHPKTEEVLGWRKRDKLDRPYEYIVVDEASMVGDEMLEDIQKHGVPLLAVGDHGQLPPVMASGDLMRKPDLRLEKIHRQAENNPIIRLSREVRETGRLDKKFEDDTHIVFRKRKHIEEAIETAYENAALEHWGAIDVGLLCWTNKWRIRLNGLARAGLGFKGPPKENEIVICLKNTPPIYNGMRGVLSDDGVVDKETPWHLHASVGFPDEGLDPTELTICGATFNRERAFESVEEMQERGMKVSSFSQAGAFFDFGYAMTVHKSQGSQFKHALFFVDRSVSPASEDWRRFAYTAITRASDILTILV